MKDHSGCSQVVSFQASAGDIGMFDMEVNIEAVIHSVWVPCTMRVGLNLRREKVLFSKQRLFLVYDCLFLQFPWALQESLQRQGHSGFSRGVQCPETPGQTPLNEQPRQ